MPSELKVGEGQGPGTKDRLVKDIKDIFHKKVSITKRDLIG